MSYEDLLSKIYAELPQLKGQLSSPTVVYIQQQNKAYITFQSKVLVEEKSFLMMERILRSAFAAFPVSLRVVSPALKDDFLEHIDRYRQVLVDFLCRNYPASVSWADSITWHSEGDRVILTFPDEFSMNFMGRENIAGRLRQAIMDIFTAEVKVELTVAGNQE
ncbi:MAG: hypothetical protein Q4C54_10055, partial [Clostridia bacterium]|nr:hypothetical protein [Clostridia bacterium]